MQPTLPCRFKYNFKALLQEEIFSLLSTCNPSQQHHLSQLHALIFTLGLHQNHHLATKLISLYPPPHASLLFNHIHSPSLSIFNSLIKSLSRHRLPLPALSAYCLLLRSSLCPDHLTFPSLLVSASPLPSLGPSLHSQILRFGLLHDPHILVSLLHMYSQSGHLNCAIHAFDEIPLRDPAAGNCIITALFRSEDVASARALFERMPVRNVVSWNTVVSGYAQNGRPVEALELFRRMLEDGVRPNKVTLLGVLSACAQAGALDAGRWAHQYVERCGIREDFLVYNCLIDMYAKCGSLRDAWRVFDGMTERSIVSWNSMILGLAMHGCGEDAVVLFGRMQGQGLKPDDVTFIGLLSACAHAGLVEQGRRFFHCMIKVQRMIPKLEHYGCMVDLLSRGGFVTEVHELMKKMPIVPDARIWGSLLCACRIHGYLELGEQAADHLLTLEPWNAGNYVLLSNIYAAKGCWDEVEQVREKMRNNMVRKTPGSSSIEIENCIHEFVTGDRSHPCSKELYKKLEELYSELKLAGYVPNTPMVIHDM